MTRELTIKTCYIYVALWLCATIPTVLGISVLYGMYVIEEQENINCRQSEVYDFMICPSKTDFDSYGDPYSAKQSDGTTVMYEDQEYKGPRVYTQHTMIVALIMLSIVLSLLTVIAYLGLNSHYKWFSVKFKSCEKE